jgi:hypothetical protein
MFMNIYVLNTNYYYRCYGNDDKELSSLWENVYEYNCVVRLS